MNLSDDISKIKKEYQKFKNSKKLLDLTRGRPSSEQLDLSDNLETVMKGDFIQDKVDTRNYGLLEGLPSARKLAGWVLNSDPKNILVNGTSSLTLLGHYLHSMIFHGDGQVAWKDLDKVTGETIGEPNFDKGKLVHVSEWCRNKKLNLEMATFYTDSIHDLPLVEKCKNSIVVSPDERLKKHADNNNLQIINR